MIEVTREGHNDVVTANVLVSAFEQHVLTTNGQHEVGTIHNI